MGHIIVLIGLILAFINVVLCAYHSVSGRKLDAALSLLWVVAIMQLVSMNS